ncbi:hypothetical protein LTR84_001060 [Exophiala bonariae]|uniref:Uncharacterized protein n=1 Tax=Exophiala bonariae TaxID=1690606 RepID=A0AAV9NV27_9EURO|nr:hypothetical protein LTR84_001060 [Exophiala bonariae]
MSCARIHRVGQTKTVELIPFATKSTFNGRQVLNNLKKAVPGLLASLNSNLFGQDIACDDEDAGDDWANDLQLGDWVELGGVLVPADDPGIRADAEVEVLTG